MMLKPDQIPDPDQINQLRSLFVAKCYFLVDLIYALLLISELKDTVSGQLKIFTPVSEQLKVLTSTPDNKKF